MKHHILSLGVVVVLLVIVSSCAAPERPASVATPDATSVGSTPRPSNPPPYPPPPTATAAGPTATPTLRPSPTATWWPSPFPTPIRPGGPTPTPLPLITPAPDARGKILFFTQSTAPDKSLQTSLFQHPVDANGSPQQTAPVSISIAGLPMISYPISQLFPAPMGRYVAIPHDWYGVTIVDIVNRRTMPLDQTMEKNLRFGQFNFGGWHPDGRHFLLFNRDATGIWLVDVEGKEPSHQLSEHAADSVAISPDGQRLIFAEQPRLLDQHNNLWLTAADGSLLQRLLEIPSRFSSSTRISELAWSPDSKSISYGRGSEIWVQPLGAQPRLLVDNHEGGYGYQWSPDNRYVIYVAREVPLPKPQPALTPYSDEAYRWAYSQLSLYLVEVSTGQKRRLISDGQRGDVNPFWSPDGKYIAFISVRSGQLGLWTANIDGSNLRQLPTNNARISIPIWLL